MAWLKSQFLKVIEWKDESNDAIVYRFPIDGKEIMKNSKLTVRESQNAIFVHKGKIADVFEPGYYTLETANIPIITSLLSWKYAFETPFKADVYFVNMKQFVDEKWGTTNPIIVRDKDFGMVRMRGFGTYSFRVSDPSVFLKEIFGTNGSFTRSDIAAYLRSMLISGITDTIAESKIPILDIAANTLEFNDQIRLVMREKFLRLGLDLTALNIENISVPEEVEKAMDTRSSMGVMGDKMGEFMQYQTAMGIRDAAKNEGGIAGAGVGLGAGVGMGKAFADAFASSQNNNGGNGGNGGGQTFVLCPKCNAKVKEGAKFCPECGQSMIVEKKTCPKCGASVKATAKFCPECGASLADKVCPSCGAKLSANAKFCPECGTKTE